MKRGREYEYGPAFQLCLTNAPPIPVAALTARSLPGSTRRRPAAPCVRCPAPLGTRARPLCPTTHHCSPLVRRRTLPFWPHSRAPPWKRTGASHLPGALAKREGRSLGSGSLAHGFLCFSIPAGLIDCALCTFLYGMLCRFVLDIGLSMPAYVLRMTPGQRNEKRSHTYCAGSSSHPPS